MTTEPTTPDPAVAGPLGASSPTSRALPPRRRTWRQRSILTFLVIATTISFVASGVVAWGAWKYRSIDRTVVSLDQQVSSEPANYLVVGSDTRAGGDPNDPSAVDDHDPLADTIMVVRVDPAEKEAAVLSLPRDLWVTVAGTGEEGRINAAYAAGHQQLIDTLRSELSIPIHHYVEVDFAGFQQVVEAIDGVPVWFDRAMRDRNSGLDVLHPGCTTLDGYGALAFARARHLEYWEQGGFRRDGSGDLGRISRQQVFLRRTITRARSKGLDNPLTLKRLIDVGTANVTIDDDLDAGELLSLAKRFSDFDADELLTYTVPTTPRTTSGGAMVLDLAVAEAQPVLDLFREGEDGDGAASTSSTGGSAPSADSTSSSSSEPPAQVEMPVPASIEVDVYNSTDRAGLAVEVADRMVALGFEVDDWGNGDDTGHPAEPSTVVRFAPPTDATAGQVSDGEVAARTVAAWVTSGARVEVDDRLEPGTVAIYLGDDFDDLVEPAGSMLDLEGPTTTAETSTSVATTTTTTTTTTT
ncbi:MAG: LCP family protein, partial [Acidimicrobiales bacterium]|nr:LCP family protein [Acidimicrobiales bacterium]